MEGQEGSYEDAVSVTGIWEGARASATTDLHVISAPEGEDVLNVHALPQRFFLDPADRMQLRAVALNGLGELVAGTELRWSMAEPAAGTIDGNGNFVASQSPGVYTEAVKVEAVVPGEGGFVRAVDFASVVVRQKRSSNVLYSVSVVPRTVLVARRGRSTLVVRAIDEFGEPAHSVTMFWDMLDGDAGEVTALGSFTAGKAPGNYPNAIRVTVEQLQEDEVITRSESISVLVTGTLSSAVVGPALAEVAPGRTAHFSLTAWDENGVELSGLVVLWSLSDESIGTIDAFGNFRAGEQPGLFEDAIQAKVIQTAR